MLFYERSEQFEPVQHLSTSMSSAAQAQAQLNSLADAQEIRAPQEQQQPQQPPLTQAAAAAQPEARAAEPVQAGQEPHLEPAAADNRSAGTGTSQQQQQPVPGDQDEPMSAEDTSVPAVEPQAGSAPAGSPAVAGAKVWEASAENSSSADRHWEAAGSVASRQAPAAEAPTPANTPMPAGPAASVSPLKVRHCLELRAFCVAEVTVALRFARTGLGAGTQLYLAGTAHCTAGRPLQWL